MVYHYFVFITFFLQIWLIKKMAGSAYFQAVTCIEIWDAQIAQNVNVPKIVRSSWFIFLNWTKFFCFILYDRFNHKDIRCVLNRCKIFSRICWRNVAQNQICYNFLKVRLRGFCIGKIIEISYREYLNNIKIMRPMRKPLK